MMHCKLKSLQNNFVPVLVIFCLALTMPFTASAGTQRYDDTAVSWPLRLRAHMLRLADIDWRLRLAAGANCRRTAAATGLHLDYIGAYETSDWPLVRRELNLTERPQVAAVVAGSPADRAGIRPGDEILAVDGVGADEMFRQANDPRLLADEIIDRIAVLDPDAGLVIALQRGKAVMLKEVQPIRLCSSRAILSIGDEIEAYSDTQHLAMTTAMVEFAQNDDEIALIAGHELAHIMLGHRKGVPLATRRQMEDDADIVGAHLARCAGYDIARAAAFWPRYRRNDSWSWARARTHRNPDDRASRVLAAADSLACPFSLPDAES